MLATLGNMPKGNVIGTLDTIEFNDWRISNWLPQLRLLYVQPTTSLSPIDQFVRRCIHSDPINIDCMTAYPSHLQIDLLPELQGFGLGTKLIDCFIDHLKTRGSMGFHLGVGTENRRAISFYKKYGLHSIEESETNVILGMQLNH